MPDISPTPVDLDAIEDRWLQMCPSCDAGMSMTCQCPTGDPRNVISNLVDEIRRLRTSIGPDSGRIRELEAEVAKLRRERDRARAMVPLPPPDPRMSVRACCGETHPHGRPECSDG